MSLVWKMVRRSCRLDSLSMRCVHWNLARSRFQVDDNVEISLGRASLSTDVSGKRYRVASTNYGPVTAIAALIGSRGSTRSFGLRRATTHDPCSPACCSRAITEHCAFLRRTRTAWWSATTLGLKGLAISIPFPVPARALQELQRAWRYHRTRDAEIGVTGVYVEDCFIVANTLHRLTVD